MGGLSLPVLGAMGLGNVVPILGVPPVAHPTASWGRMAERAPGKDTITGHWEMMGVPLDRAAGGLPARVPPEVLDPWIAATGVPGVLANRVASGTADHRGAGGGAPAHREAHRLHLGRLGVPGGGARGDGARSRPSTPGAARRGASSIRCGWRGSSPVRSWGSRAPTSAPTTARTSPCSPPRPTVLERLAAAGVPVVGVGKIGDIFDRRGLSEDVHTRGNADGLRRTTEILARMERGLLFVNLVDFDMLWGHRNDAPGYARGLEEMDRGLPPVLAGLRPGDVFALTADHGCDPTTPSTDHSREHVPLLVRVPGRAGVAAGHAGDLRGSRRHGGGVLRRARQGRGGASSARCRPAPPRPPARRPSVRPARPSPAPRRGGTPPRGPAGGAGARRRS